MRKYITLLLLVLFCSSALCTEASAGNVEVQITPVQKIDITYTKVGSWEKGNFVLEEAFAESGVDLNVLKKNGDMKQAIEKLETYEGTPTGRITTEQGVATICNLEKGVYLLQGSGIENGEVQSALISIPFWDDASGKMNYEIKWTPKIETVIKAAATGDTNLVIFLIVICAISLLFIARTLYFSLRLC